MIEIRQYVYAHALPRHEPDDRAHSVDAARVHPHRLTHVVLHEPTKTIAEEAGSSEREGGILVHWRANLRRDELTKGRRRDQPSRADTSAIQHEAHPFGHVRYTRPDGACRRDTVGAPNGDGTDGIVPLGMRHGDIRLVPDRRHQRFRLRHAKRHEDSRAKKRVPRHPRYTLDDQT